MIPPSATAGSPRGAAMAVLVSLAVAFVPAGSTRGQAPAEVGFSGVYKTGSWTPLKVPARADGVAAVRVWIDDADGELVGSAPIETASTDPGAARFRVRFGRPDGRALVEWSDGGRDPLSLPAPLESTARVLLVIGDLPSAERAARLLAREDGSRMRVVALPDASDLGPDGLDLDGADAVVACGSAVAASPVAGLAAIDEWTRRGGRLVFPAGASAAPPAFRDGPPAEWLPGAAGRAGRVERMVPLRRTAALETYAKAGRPLDRAALAGLEAPLLADTRTLDGEIEAWEGGSPSDLPLVVRKALGFGTVAWAGVDLDRGAFRGWSGTDSLLVELLGGRPGEGGRAGEAARAGLDLGGQLRLAVDRFDGVRAVPFELIAGLALLYVACLYPLEWWLVSRSGRPRLAWLTLPLLVAAFTLLAWQVGTRAKGREWRTRRAGLVDVDVAGGAVRGTDVLGVWSPENALVDVTAGPGADGVAAPGARTAVSWFAIRGRGMGAVDSPSSHPSLASEPYLSGPGADALVGVPLAADSSRVFEAEWSGAAAGPVVESSLRRDPQGTLRGTLVSRLPFALEDCALVHAGWSYDVGTLAPGGVFDPLAGRGPRTLAAALTRSSAQIERTVTERWRVDGTDVARILEIAGFHEAAGGAAYTSLDAGALARLDLSALLTLDRAVLVGRGPAATAWKILPATPDDAPAGALWRIVIPLDPVPAEAPAAPPNGSNAP